MAADLYRRALNRAATILGGRQQLARYLRIDLHLLEKWCMPAVRPPEYALQCVARLLRKELSKNYKSPSKTSSVRSVSRSARRKKAGGR